MALSQRDIVITPNRGASSEPTIKFTGADATSSATITLRVINSGTVGTLSYEGTNGQLFSITDSMNGTIFSANDISGIPSIEVLDTGVVKLAQYDGSVTVNTATSISNAKLTVQGGSYINGTLTATTIVSKIAQDYVVSVTANSATTTLDLSQGNTFYVTMSASTTFAFSNVPTGSNLTNFSIITYNSAGGYAISWPASVTWAGAQTPARTTTSGKSDIYTFFTLNAGTNIIGSLSILNY